MILLTNEKKYVTLILIAFLLSGKKAISQKKFHQVFQEKISLDSIQQGRTIQYADVVKFAWNQKDSGKIVLIYLNKDKKFIINLYELDENHTIKKTIEKKIDNLIIFNDNDFNTFHNINQLIYVANTIWVHYDNFKLTKINISDNNGMIWKVEHLDLEINRDFSFKYIYTQKSKVKTSMSD